MQRIEPDASSLRALVFQRTGTVLSMASCSLLVLACSGSEPQSQTPDGAPPVVLVRPVVEEPTVAELPPDEEIEQARPSCAVACEQDGLCALRDGACVALEDGPCEASRACRDKRRCTAEEGVCVRAESPAAVDACDRWVALLTRCSANMPPSVRASVEQVAQSVAATSAQATDERVVRALAKSCEQMIVAFGQTPYCQNSGP